MSLIHWYPLINDTTDQGLNPKNGALIGSASFIDGGKFGKCLSAGTGSQTENGVNIATNLVSELGTNYSVACWVKVNGTHVHYNGTIISSGNWNSTCWSFGMSQDRTQIDCFGQGYNQYLTLSSPLSLNTWYHLASVQKNGTNYVYVNGILAGSKSQAPVSASDASNFNIGRETYASGYFSFNGNISDVRIYNHALSPKEVKELSKGLRLHYPLKQPRPYTDLASDTSLVVYNNYGVTSSITATGKTFMGYPIYRLTMAPTSAALSSFKTTLGNQGVYQGTYNFAANTKYAYWIYYKPVTHMDIRVGGIASNIHGWTEIPPKYFNDGWYRVGQYRDGSVTTAKSDNIFTSFYTPTAAVNVPISIDFCGPHLVSGTAEVQETFGLDAPSSIEYDVSGYGQHGIISGTIVSNLDTPKYNQSYQFNGNAYIETPELSFSGMTNSYTITYWAKIADMDNKMMWGFLDGNRLNLYSAANYFLWNTGDGSNNPFQSGGNAILFAPYNNAWHHYTITGNGTTVTLYIDGNLVGIAKAYKSITGTKIIISGWDKGSYYKWTNGQLVDYRIYATCLSAADVKELYNTSVSVDNFGNVFAGELKEI